MSGAQVIVEGTLLPDGRLVPDEKLNLPPGRVRMTIQTVPAPAGPADGFMVRMQQIWAAQDARGHVPRTREEVDAEINALRDEAEEEMQAIERLHEESVRAHQRQGPEQEPGR